MMTYKYLVEINYIIPITINKKEYIMIVFLLIKSLLITPKKSISPSNENFFSLLINLKNHLFNSKLFKLLFNIKIFMNLLKFFDTNINVYNFNLKKYYLI